jgi:hypothetical protein
MFKLLHIHCRNLLALAFSFFIVFSSRADMTANDHLLSVKTKNGDEVPYLLTAVNLKSPKYAITVQPGGSGSMNLFGNFLVRSREIFADEETVVVDTDTTTSPERMRAILDAIRSTYPDVQIYIIGTSRGTFGSMGLGEKLDGEVAGFIHTSSMSQIAVYDTRQFKSRHLIVHHENDGCHVTPYSSAKYNHEKYGTPFISVSGGTSTGDPCKAFAYHGYNGIEPEVVGKIKAWIKQSTPSDGVQGNPTSSNKT